MTWQYPLPNLDDRTYAELTAEAQALIPSLYPGWSNHNPSDPGIVLMEMLAWLTEMLLFQVNEIPAANTEKFLKLLNGPDPAWTRTAEMSLEEATRRTVRGLRERYRAITPDDYEHLAWHVGRNRQRPRSWAKRANCGECAACRAATWR